MGNRGARVLRLVLSWRSLRTTTTIDFALSQGGVISGTVRRADTGAPVSRQLSVYTAQRSFVKSVSSHFQTGPSLATFRAVRQR